MSYVLVVDPDLAICELLQFILEDEGYPVKCAREARQALQLLQQHCPKLILCDMFIFVPDGQSLYEVIKTAPATQAIPLVLMTTTKTVTAPPRVDAVLHKPFELDHLLALVSHHAPA